MLQSRSPLISWTENTRDVRINSNSGGVSWLLTVLSLSLSHLSVSLDVPAGLYLTSCLPAACQYRAATVSRLWSTTDDLIQSVPASLTSLQSAARTRRAHHDAHMPLNKHSDWRTQTSPSYHWLALHRHALMGQFPANSGSQVLWWSSAWQRRLTRSHLPWEILPLLESVLWRSSIIRSLCQQWSLSRHTTSIIAISYRKIITINKIFQPGEV